LTTIAKKAAENKKPKIRENPKLDEYLSSRYSFASSVPN